MGQVDDPDLPVARGLIASLVALVGALDSSGSATRSSIDPHNCWPLAPTRSAVRAQSAGKNGSAASSAAASGSQEFDYDLLIIGCGVGGHGAALHAVECVSSAWAAAATTAATASLMPA